jgi:hypothetical protein
MTATRKDVTSADVMREDAMSEDMETSGGDSGKQERFDYD